MKSSYKKLGPYIQAVSHRNNDTSVKTLLGVSISKEFIPSIANIVGTDMSNYKIVKKNQFAYGPVTSRNGDKISIALLSEEECIISASYTVFEIIDINKLMPEYLMMWFRRPEFDRYARYMSHGSVREIFGWEEMCDVELPVPPIEKQREIVEEYHAVTRRIALNEELNRKLEETAQTIYKQWFVEFEFPMTEEYARSIGKPELEGKPYKSSGGEMVWNEELGKEIPKGWEDCKLSDIATITMGQSPDGETYNKEGNGMIFYQGRTDFGYRFPDITTYTTYPKKIAMKNDILISVRAPVGDLNIAIEDCAIGRGLGALRSKLKYNSHLFYTLQNLKSHFDISDSEGTIFGSINKDDLHNMKVVYSEKEINKFDKIVNPIDVLIKNYSIQNQKLISLKEFLLTRMTKVGG